MRVRCGARPSKRLGGTKRWQGVQRTDEEAKEVVEKAPGSGQGPGTPGAGLLCGGR